MIEITAKAEAYWESLGIKESVFFKDYSRIKQIVIDAFEAGYLAHKH